MNNEQHSYNKLLRSTPNETNHGCWEAEHLAAEFSHSPNNTMKEIGGSKLGMDTGISLNLASF
jgi:hypothetical protein